MDTFYWATEYISVLCGYVFLMFLWPSVVFEKHLNGKSVRYRFGFCVVTQIVIINAVILGLGFFHVLNRYIVVAVFYGIFLIMLLYHVGKCCFQIVDEAVGRNIDLLYCIRLRFKVWIWEFFAKIKSRFWEYMMLAAVIVFGIMYFSYGAVQVHSYGHGDLYAQHALIYGLMEGNIFPDGDRVGAMHCFIYCMNALFDISVQSILQYLQGIHMAVFLLAAYCLLREVFHWRCMPILVLTLYLVWGVTSVDMIYSISCLQWTVPTEFGLYIPFLSTLFFVRYSESRCQEKRRYDRNLILLIISFAAAASIHYYAAAIALFICVIFAVCRLGKNKMPGWMGANYIPVIMASILFIFVYIMTDKGLFECIPNSVIYPIGHMLVLSVVLMPVDVLFFKEADSWKDSLLQTACFAIMAGIYGAAVLTGNYRGYLFYEITRYNSAAVVTDSIVDNFPKDSYVIISPTDELYPVIEDGWHEELLTFIENTKQPDYTLPHEYVFIYVEKRPLLYAQTHFFDGPFWLAGDQYWEKYSEGKPNGSVSRGSNVAAGEISDMDAQKEIPDAADWEIYTHLAHRTVLESKAYDWCQRFMQSYPYELNVYYEDESFVCYYLAQNVNSPYRLGME